MNKEEITYKIPNNQIHISEIKDEDCLIWISPKALYMANTIDKLQQENQELKKQLKELEEHSANAINKQVSRGIDLVNQQKEFIEYLEKIIVDSKAGSGQQYYAQEHLKMFKEIIGGKE